MEEVLFVDGYNIINAWPELKKLSKISLELARQELINSMVEYSAYKGIEVFVVFDAFHVKDCASRIEEVKGVKVVFSKYGETADHYIEKSVAKYVKSGRAVKVATSDWVEQQVIMAQGAIRVSASELVEELKRFKESVSEKIRSRQDDSNTLWDNISPEVLEKLKKMRNRN
ncbi:NYN domain-containing protein [Caldanaerobius polysaccharolyticus]|uniref:NYN domain-containing protein n=1 Tax=Caldanaerobius polysaccharolyticus TaxID=44256 RepID=UPI00047B10BF|nr:NYN domain-containing protein [Caldanaerobius polysaccharolyticus]